MDKDKFMREFSLEVMKFKDKIVSSLKLETFVWSCLALSLSCVPSAADASSENSARGSRSESGHTIHSALPSQLRVAPNGMSSMLPGSGATPTKLELMKALQDIQAKNVLELTSIDERMKKVLKDSTTVSLKEKDLKGSGRSLKVMGEDIQALTVARTEINARRDFVDRLSVVIDGKWTGQELKEFLVTQLLDMSVTELTSAAPDAKLGKFLVYLSVAIREVSEPRENLIDFVEDYMNFATVLAAKSPTEFLLGRSYTNGTLSYSAQPADAAEIGELIEKSGPRGPLGAAAGTAGEVVRKTRRRAVPKVDPSLMRKLQKMETRTNAPVPSKVEKDL
jgi:hypothetical protein